MSLAEIPVPASQLEIPRRGGRLMLDGLTRSRRIQCFDFVPCSYGTFYNALASQPRGTFCEWGSGIGIATALAELLGFDAHGIEIDPALAAASRQLLKEHRFQATIQTGDYLQIDYPADIYFVYCWPGQMEQVKQRFDQTAPSGARLLMAYGAEDIHCLIRGNEGQDPEASPRT